MATRAQRLEHSLRDADIDMILLTQVHSAGGQQARQECARRIDVLFIWPVPPYTLLEWMRSTARLLRACHPTMKTIVVADDAFVSLRSLNGARPRWSPEARLEWIRSCARAPSLGAPTPGCTMEPDLAKAATEAFHEFRLYGLANGVFAITADTMAVIRKLVPRQPMLVLPYVSPILLEGSNLTCTAPSAAEPSAVLVGAMHGGNIRGLGWFARAVLPKLSPHFVLHVVGKLSNAIAHMPDLQLSLCLRGHLPRARACIQPHGLVPYAQLADLICRASASINPSMEPAGVSTKSILALSLGAQVITNTLDGTFSRSQPHPPYVHICEPHAVRCYADALAEVAKGGMPAQRARVQGPRYVDRRFGGAAFDAALQRMFDRLGILCDG
jgi:hypothetical protein